MIFYMKSLVLNFTINATIEQIWAALTQASEIEKWDGGPNVIMDDKMGTKFTLWDGSIFGTNIEVQPQKLLKQEWSVAAWANPSIVTFTLTPHRDQTTVFLDHQNIPDEDVKDIKSGWNDYYLGAIKTYLETKK